MLHFEHPCPCGYHGDPSGRCTCSAATITRYQHRISGPVLDRIDLHVDVPRVDYDNLAANRLSEPSAAIRQRVERARERQARRLTGTRLTWVQPRCASSANWTRPGGRRSLPGVT